MACLVIEQREKALFLLTVETKYEFLRHVAEHKGAPWEEKLAMSILKWTPHRRMSEQVEPRSRVVTCKK